MNFGGPKSRSRGFTFIELLVVITIIGILSSVGMVSYRSVRTKARDTKRVSDAKQIQTALELYFETHSSYPYDGENGDAGLLVGLPLTKTFSDGGFAPSSEGMVYMGQVPRNPEPGGTEYVYRSLHRDGRNCERRDGCDSYAILFTLEGAIGALGPGEHGITPEGIAGEGHTQAGVTGLGGQLFGLKEAQELIGRYTGDAAEIMTEVVEDERVEFWARVLAPILAAMSLANAGFTMYTTASAASFFLYIFTQPFFLLGRKRRKSWGVVYNSLSKLPVDLAMVRLLDAETGRRIKTAVTDREGRFSFLVKEGDYRIEVAKPEFTYPSKFVQDTEKDGAFENVYCGEGIIEIGEEGALLTPNVPVDPPTEEAPDDAVVRKTDMKKFGETVAVVSPALGVLSFIVDPSLYTGLLLLAQMVAYSLFKRLAIQKEPKQWGFVYEKGVGRAVSRAVLRIFALPYHKLVESQVTDHKGRYHFRVGSGHFYMTVTRRGYAKTESDPLDLREATEPAVIASDVPLMREGDTLAPDDSEGQSLLSGPPKKGLIVSGSGGTGQARPVAKPSDAPEAGEGLDILPPEENK